MTPEEFLNEIETSAKKLWDSHNILPSIAAAQSAQETGWGDSTLMHEYNNYFGIKASGDCSEENAGEEPTGRDDSWSGSAVCAWTWEHIDGEDIETVEPFRAYDSMDDSFKDYGEFLQTERYSAVVGEEDYSKAAQALYDAGYATDPNYPQSLINIIEEYNLQEWDQEVINSNEGEENNEDDNNRINIRLVDPNLEFDFELEPLTSEDIQYIFIHHPAASNFTIEQVHQMHKDPVDGNDWGGIGYNYYIEKNNGGIVYIGRGMNKGAHVSGYNHISLGVCLEGEYSSEEVDEYDWKILVAFVRQLMEEHNVSVENVLPHRAKGSTECPGNNFDMEAFRNDLESEDFTLPDEDDDQSESTEYETYVVQAGDTLTSIANKFNVEINQIVEWNNISNPNSLQVGQELIIYSEREEDTGNNPPVEEGEGLVDYMERIGLDSSFSNRARLAEKYGIDNYTGTAEQNDRLLNLLSGNN